MHKLIFRLMFNVGIILSVCVFFSGCAHQSSLPIVYSDTYIRVAWPDKELENRFQDYWSDQANSNFDDAYSIEAPYIRELLPFNIYKRIFTTDNSLHKVEVLRIEPVHNKFYHIAIKLFHVNDKGSVSSSFHRDMWVYADRSWFHVRKDPLLRSYFP